VPRPAKSIGSGVRSGKAAFYKHNSTSFLMGSRIKPIRTQSGYLHSALGYRSPIQAEEEYYRNLASHEKAA